LTNRDWEPRTEDDELGGEVWYRMVMRMRTFGQYLPLTHPRFGGSFAL
jgi:hypothetical protein